MTPRQLIPAPEPDYATPPGETLRERLDELGMTQAELARRTGLTPKHVNQVMQGVASLSPDVAQRLEYATGTPVRWWLRLEADYRAAQTRTSQRDILPTDISWAKTMPVAALVNAGALPAAPRDPVSRFRQLLVFFGVVSVDAYKEIWRQPAAAFRQSHAYSIDPNAVAAWLRLGELAVQQDQPRRFNADRLRAALPQLRTSTTRPVREALLEIINIAKSCGLSIVFVPDIPGTRAYGATRWIGQHPLVQLSRRGGTDDQIWITIYHELGHILLHNRKAVFLDQLEENPIAINDDLPDYEKEAQHFAWSLAIPDGAQETMTRLTSNEAVLDFAEEQGIAPSLVVARLQSLGLWSYRDGARLKRRVHDADLPAIQDRSDEQPSKRDQRRMSWRLPGENK
jgi:HTH-type transcriptional regulator / antitoxin HigA